MTCTKPYVTHSWLVSKEQCGTHARWGEARERATVVSEKELKKKEDDAPPHVWWRHRKRHCASWHSTLGKPTTTILSAARSLVLLPPSPPLLRCPVRRRALAGALGTGQLRCCVESECRVGRRCGRCGSTSGGGSGGGEGGGGGSDGVAGISGGASLGGLAAMPGSSVLRRVTRWKDSATASCRFGGSAVAAVAT